MPDTTLSTTTDLDQALRNKVIALEAEIAALTAELEPIHAELVRLNYKRNQLMDTHRNARLLLADLHKK